MALNACELEIDLFCRGVRIPPEVSLEGARGISRTRAGLGSGLEVVLPGGSWLKDKLWVNMPVEERFVKDTPYVLGGSPPADTASRTSEARPPTRSRSPASRPGITGRRPAASR